MARPRSATTDACRALWLAGGFAALGARQSINDGLQTAWDALRASPIVAHDSFEPAVVLVSFIVFLLFWKAMDVLVPMELTRTMRMQESEDVTSWRIERGGAR